MTSEIQHSPPWANTSGIFQSGLGAASVVQPTLAEYLQEERAPSQKQVSAPDLEQPLLSVNNNALKGDEEMRRMFGRDVVQMRHQEDQAADLGECVLQEYGEHRNLSRCSHA